MNKDTDDFALEEAIAYIRRHFTESDGLLAQIEKGEQIDENQVEMIRTAFETIQAAWKDTELVPKETARLIYQTYNALSRLEHSLEQHPDGVNEISNFCLRVSEWIEKLFSGPSTTEENAIMFLSQHIFGTPPFNIALIRGEVNKDSLGELLDALEILAPIWQRKKQVSKFAVFAMVGSSWLFDRVEMHYRGNGSQQFQEAKRQVNEHIIRCLS